MADPRRDPAIAFATFATDGYDAFGRRVETAPSKALLFFYETRGHLVEEIAEIAGANNDEVRAYVFLEDERVGLVDNATVEAGPIGLGGGE